MAKTVSLSSTTKGSLGETEDWWRLVVSDDGTAHVEHEWSHHDPYGKRQPSSGTETISVDAFLSGQHDNAMKDKLRAALDEQNDAS